MKTGTIANENWRPGKQGVNFVLDGTVAEFIRDCAETIVKIYVEADTPVQMLNLLEEQDWTANKAQTKYATYDNRTKVFELSPTKQIRYSVTLDSAGRFTWAIREWYNAPR